MRIKKPIFIIGVGRSGSTIFHRIFSLHPQVAYLTGFSNKFPKYPSINKFFMNAIEYPIIGNLLKTKIEPKESYNFWEYYCKGFRRPCRDLFPEDVTEKAKKNIHQAMENILTDKRKRLLIKISGWPRIGYLHEIFNDAKFVHIIRDGRAVANSMINMHWWWGWKGPNNWRWGELTQAQKAEWEKYNKSFIALAAIEWKILMDAFEKAKKYVSSDNIFEFKYEDFCVNPLDIFRDVIDFCNLEWSGEFGEFLKNYRLKNANYKWKDELSKLQQNILEEILGDYLIKFNYL